MNIQAFQNSLIELLDNWLEVDRNKNLSMTLTFNNDTSLAKGEALLKKFHQQLQREINGRNWQKKPFVDFVAIPEKIEVNLHYHLLMRVANESDKPAVLKAAGEIWLKLVPSATTDWQDNPDVKWNDYIGKSWFSLNDFIISMQWR